MGRASQIPAIALSARKAIDRAFAGHPEHRYAFATEAAIHFKDGKSAARLEHFIRAPMFRAFVAGMLKATAGRFADTCSILFERILAGDTPSSVAAAGALMGMPKFRAIASSYLKPPADRERCKRFMLGLVELSSRLGTIGEEYLDLFASRECTLLMQDYREHTVIRDTLMDMLIQILKVKKSPDIARAHAALLSEDCSRTIILMSEVIGMGDVTLSSLRHVLIRHPEPARFFKMLGMFCRHYRPSHLQAEPLIKFNFARLADLWRVFWIAGTGDMAAMGAFIEEHGHESSDSRMHTWDLVLETEPEHALTGMKVMISPAFKALHKRYCKDPAVVRVLRRHLVAAISSKTGKARDALVGAILETGIDSASLKRRSLFFDWYYQEPRPRLIAGVINGYCFHEYITRAINAKIQRQGAVAPCYRDEGHKVFSALIDRIYPNTSISRESLFANIYKQVQSRLWAPVYDAFPEREEELANIRAITETAGIEDNVLPALQSLEAGDLKSYHDHLLGTWLDSPGRVSEAAGKEEWHGIEFKVAVPYCLETVVPLIGMIGLRESGDSMAYTNGKVILLPSRVTLFNDPQMPLESNRNLAAYIALSLHEAGHIIGGSYHFNISDYVDRLERPELFRIILNMFEDYRIESFMVKINAHAQARELFDMFNRRQSVRLFGRKIPFGARFLVYIFDTAGGYNSDLLPLPDYQHMVEELMNMDLHQGRFGSLAELAGHGVERLRTIEAANPLAAFMIAEEFYEIMKEWTEDALNGMSDTIMLPPPELMQGISTSAKPSRPLTREDLDELYRLFNRNPESFIRANGLKHLPAIMSRDRSGNEKTACPLENFKPDYENKGTIDESTRTLLDDAIAGYQLSEKQEDLSAEIVEFRQTNHNEKDPLQEIEEYNKEAVKNLVRKATPGTRSYTCLSQVKEYGVRKVNSAYMTKFRQYEPLVNRVYIELSRLLPALEEEYESATDEGELDLELLVEAMSDRRNRPEEPELFEAVREGSRRSLEVVIGLDASGSTADTVNASGTSILDVEKAFSIILGRALNFITPDVKVYAFNSETSTNIYRAETLQAVSSFKADNGNRDGDFIRYLTAVLKESDAESRFLFLLSDGKPNSINYNGSDALQDTLLAMREAVNTGIKLVYYNFDRVRSDYFTSFQKEATYARYFTDPRQILPTIPELLRSITQSVM